MNMRFTYRLLIGCFCMSGVILLLLLLSKLWGGFPEEWKILFRVICLVTVVVLAFTMVCCYLGGAFGRISGAVSLPDKPRLEILKEHAEYDRSHKEKPYTYEFRMGGKVPEILKKYEYDKYLEGVEPGTDEVAFQMLDFVCDHFKHIPCAKSCYGKLAFRIMQHERTHQETNCRGLSKLLTSLLLLNGIKARFVTCMPYEEPFNDCHVVVDCVLPSGKRIMLDPTYRLYLMDKQGEYLSIEGLRKALLGDEEITHNTNAGYNGGTFDLKFYRDYMAKNLIRISSGVLSADGMEENDVRQVILVPKGYPVKNFKYTGNFVYDDEAFWRIE